MNSLGETHNMVFQSSSSPRDGGSIAPGQKSLWGKKPHKHFASSQPLSIYSNIYMQLLIRLCDINILQCINIVTVIHVSFPALTAQQGSSCCYLHLCKMSLVKSSHKIQVSSFCSGVACLFLISLRSGPMIFKLI